MSLASAFKGTDPEALAADGRAGTACKSRGSARHERALTGQTTGRNRSTQEDTAPATKPAH